MSQQYLEARKAVEAKRGPCDSASNLAQMFRRISLVPELILRRIDVPPFRSQQNQAHWDWDKVHIPARIFCNLRIHRDPHHSREFDSDILFIGEVLFFGVEEGKVLRTNEAQMKFVEVVKKFFLLPDKSAYTRKTEADYISAVAAEGPLTGFDFDLKTWFWTKSQVDAYRNDVQEHQAGCLAFLLWLAESPVLSMEDLNMNALISYFLSMTRRGFRSEREKKKIQSEFRTTFHSYVTLNASLISTFYNVFRYNLKHEDAKYICEILKGNTPQNQLSFLLLLVRIQHSMMAPYYYICHAIKTFPEFGWSKVVEQLPIEWGHLEAAVNTVGDDPYYRFRENRDFPISEFPRFFPLRYVAMKLFWTVGEEIQCDLGSVTKLQPLVKASIDLMVDRYAQIKKGSSDNGPNTKPQVQSVVSVYRQIINQPEANMPDMIVY